jgi:glutamate racemase
MIGVFDSGVGGLSVLAALARAMPQVDFTYLADTAFVPYGNKSDALIRERVIAIGDALVARGCSLIVVACNTATVSAVRTLRERHPSVPIVGIEPGVKPAALASRTRKIAVLATESTARSERLSRLIAEYAQGVEVFIEPCPGWATQVETLALNDPELSADVHRRITPLLDAGVDQIVLGCTHYSFLRGLLDPLVAGRAALVEVAEPVALQARRLYVGQSEPGQIDLLASARPEQLRCALPKLALQALIPRVHACHSIPV